MADYSYAVVTPVRDEAANLGRLADSFLAQSLRPAAWIIVDNGSSDASRVVADELSSRYPWIDSTAIDGTESPVPGAPIVRAFHAGLARLTDTVDIVVKVDADVSFSSDHFERLLGEFEADPSLGIAGGLCYELQNGAWTPVHSTGAHVRGAVRAYRFDCLRQILPLPERTGWDTIDEAQAAVRGWDTRTLEHLRFDHHRRLGERDGQRSSRYRAQGDAAHYLGYSPLYVTLRALFNARRDPYALAMLLGYSAAALRGDPRHPESAARAHLRSSQRLRGLPARLREALGR